MDELGYKSGTTVGGKWGCAASVLMGGLVFVPLWFLTLFGDCPTGAACHDGELATALGVIAISAIAATAVGLAVRWLVNRR